MALAKVNQGGGSKNPYFNQPLGHEAILAVLAALAAIKAGKKPVEVTPEWAEDMAQKIEDGGTFISYERNIRQPDGTTRPVENLLHAVIWCGRPGIPGSKVVMSGRAKFGSNAITAEVVRGNRTYTNITGVKPSEWCRLEDQKAYEEACKAEGIILPTKQAKSRPSGDNVPVGQTAQAPDGAGEQPADADVPFSE